MKKTFEIEMENHPAGVTLVDGHLVMAISVDYLRNLIESDETYAEYDEDEDKWKSVKVLDEIEWARDVRDALNMEEEDGSTLITKALDKAFTEAIESGCESVQLPSD